MVEYKCDKCSRIFNRKQSYDAHTIRKFSCIKDLPKLIKINQILPIDENKCKCNYCNKEFCNKYTLERHLDNRCKVKKEDTNKKEEIYQILLKQMREMEENNKKMEENNKKMFNELKAENLKLKNELAKKDSITNNTINNINSQTNNTNNQQNNIKNLQINLIAHGKEDLSFITEDQIKKILYKGFKSIENLTEIVHFDKNRPENHNVYISNIKDSYIMRYDGNDWKLMNRENCLQDMYDDKCDYLVEKFEQSEGKLDESILKRFGNFLSRKDDDKIIEQTKKEIKLVLYNNRKIPEETRRLLRLNDEIVMEQLC
ncbi:MAG: hypothetical protein Terrestrivirus1_214 [Terrestrivirus sp.]|uniref:C2H2-type domain-containing protein n=1 Tax=Terrestrivirus sp. TaxID=2487775 RepID=A0A3G4ZKI3_9VIRU|nr:MAG: hypothetical protein Terrestrivirus1_214 [Terrestrivirus sp.]